MKRAAMAVISHWRNMDEGECHMLPFRESRDREHGDGAEQHWGEDYGTSREMRSHCHGHTETSMGPENFMLRGRRSQYNSHFPATVQQE